MKIRKAKSITHEHLLSILNTESESRITGGGIVRILDVGCGDGYFMEYIMQNYGILNSSIEFEIYGFDVDNHGVQSKGYFTKTIELLEKSFPEISWVNRLSVISDQESWPYSDNFFDFIISNQVVEHVRDHETFFSEINRTLKTNGCSIHLFPLKHYIYEGHLHLPLVHKIMNYDFMISWIKCLSRLGIGKYKTLHKDSSVSLEQYAERHADYMCFFTNYLSYAEVLMLGKKHCLRTSFRYTQEFYKKKLQSVLGMKPKYKYQCKRSSAIDWLSIHFLKYVSSITLVLHKNETYTDK